MKIDENAFIMDYNTDIKLIVDAMDGQVYTLQRYQDSQGLHLVLSDMKSFNETHNIDVVSKDRLDKTLIF
jgi:hypothetical protein